MAATDILISHATSTPASSLPSATILRIYSWYRIALCAVLVTLVLATSNDPLVGRDIPQLFIALCGVYAFFAALTVIWLPTLKNFSKRVLLGHFGIDVAILTALHHVSGGTNGEFGLLMLISTAASASLMRGQVALLMPALSTIAILGDTLYLLQSDASSHQSLLVAGTQGMLQFATSIAFQALSQRLQATQQIAQERAADVDKLQNLNQLIVQRMRTGIVVVDKFFQIKMINEAATELLLNDNQRVDSMNDETDFLPAILLQRLQNWLGDANTNAKPFHIGTAGRELIARFTRLDSETEGDILIFLEDSGLLAQRAQQLKLAALGRLTASIAHEIRNPLSAISHAGQLLRESPQLPDGDERLVDIVLNHSRRINSIVENVLQLSRRMPPNPRRLQLGEWLREFIFQYQQGCQESPEIEVLEMARTEITVDPDQLSQVLTNLIDNALRYSKKATGVAIARLIIATDNKKLPQLDVVDDGAGIDRHDHEKIFEPFFTTESKGNGLGLYIARELCEINQARLHYLRNEAGKSCFRINFSHPDRKPLVNE